MHTYMSHICTYTCRYCAYLCHRSPFIDSSHINMLCDCMIRYDCFNQDPCSSPWEIDENVDPYLYLDLHQKLIGFFHLIPSRCSNTTSQRTHKQTWLKTQPPRMKNDDKVCSFVPIKHILSEIVKRWVKKWTDYYFTQVHEEHFLTDKVLVRVQFMMLTLLL